MPSAREIRVRMNSIQQTRKITNAMYLISSAKLRKAKQEWDQTRPYFQALKAEVKRIFRTSGHVQSRYLYPDEGELDQVPEAAFYNVGSIDEALQKAKETAE